jgi:hypothetical protein
MTATQSGRVLHELCIDLIINGAAMQHLRARAARQSAGASDVRRNVMQPCPWQQSPSGMSPT